VSRRPPARLGHHTTAYPATRGSRDFEMNGGYRLYWRSLPVSRVPLCYSGVRSQTDEGWVHGWGIGSEASAHKAPIMNSMCTRSTESRKIQHSKWKNDADSRRCWARSSTGRSQWTRPDGTPAPWAGLPEQAEEAYPLEIQERPGVRQKLLDPATSDFQAWPFPQEHREMTQTSPY